MINFPMNLPKEFLIGSKIWQRRNPEWMEIVKKYPHHGRRYGTEEERNNLKKELEKMKDTNRRVGTIRIDEETESVHERVFSGTKKEAASFVNEKADKRYCVKYPTVKNLYIVFEKVDESEYK